MGLDMHKNLQLLCSWEPQMIHASLPKKEISAQEKNPVCLVWDLRPPWLTSKGTGVPDSPAPFGLKPRWWLSAPTDFQISCCCLRGLHFHTWPGYYMRFASCILNRPRQCLPYCIQHKFVFIEINHRGRSHSDHGITRLTQRHSTECQCVKHLWQGDWMLGTSF